MTSIPGSLASCDGFELQIRTSLMMVCRGSSTALSSPFGAQEFFRPRFLNPVDHAAALMKVTNRLGER
jgi:hypothetical protein